MLSILKIGEYGDIITTDKTKMGYYIENIYNIELNWQKDNNTYCKVL